MAAIAKQWILIFSISLNLLVFSYHHETFANRPLPRASAAISISYCTS